MYSKIRLTSFLIDQSPDAAGSGVIFEQDDLLLAPITEQYVFSTLLRVRICGRG